MGADAIRITPEELSSDAIATDRARRQDRTMEPQLFSIGHSNLPLDRLVGLLTQHGIEALADIRRYPGSRKFPYLSRESLAAALPQAGIEYHWMEALGGRRRAMKDPGDSPNLGLRDKAKGDDCE
jgi:hypothetical protein